MRVTLDTNVLIAAFISRGACHELFEHLVRHHDLVLSSCILGEFRDKLVSKFGIDAADADAAVALITSRAVVVEPAALPEPTSRDPDDDWILATTRAGSSACLVTGDRDLLTLEEYEGIAILRPADFWRYEAEQA